LQLPFENGFFPGVGSYPGQQRFAADFLAVGPDFVDSFFVAMPALRQTTYTPLFLMDAQHS
jgi:hypothetical protein